METQNTLRDQLSEALTSVETQAKEVETPVEPVVEQAEPEKERPRDQNGKFAPKQQTQETAPVTEEKPKPSRPSTWKKDYWEKFDALDPELQGYINQRESEYKTGVSTYKAEAERAKDLNDAIAPFIPDLQKNNINPAQWIRNLGNAHQTLVYGSPAQKYQMFQQLARDYGVDLNAPNQEQPDQSQWLSQQIQSLSQGFNDLKQRQEIATLAQQASRQGFVLSESGEIRPENPDKYPHFEMVRETMAGLLQAGLAQDLPTAYEKAVRMNDEAWQASQQQQTQAESQQRAQAAQKAKTAAVSPKSATPSGTVKAVTGKGLRDTLSALLDDAGARV